MTSSSPSLIALDWGTSSLRAFLLDGNGNVVDSKTAPWGIMHVPGGNFATAFDELTTGWRTQGHHLTSIAAGMIGSANGWVNAPYCATPSGMEELAAALTLVPDASLYVVPGIATLGQHSDVMRGEETQIVGALERHPELAARSLLVLPGTHSKWAHVSDGKVTGFATYITGELFAVLCEHSTLGRFAREAQAETDPSTMESAFARGIDAAQRSAAGVAPLLFSARSQVLTDRLAANASLQYLSGLLIGDEVRCGLTEGGRPTALVGDAALCNRYVTALRLFGIDDVPVLDAAAQTGLWSIAHRAGLTARNERTTR